MSVAWVVPLIVLQRVFELALSASHVRALIARGGREFHRESFPVMAGLHTLFLLSLAVESYPWRVAPDALTWGCLAALSLVTAGRYWVIASLGRCWTVRIVVVPGEPVRKTGPYRFLRHPNYVVIVLEFILFPLLMRAPATLAVFSAANLLVLRQRIRLEETALREHTDYADKFD